MKKLNQRGVTLVELLVVIVISSIALMALSVPLVAERSFWASGTRQAEAQREAQLVMRAIARVAHESSSYAVAGSQITFTAPCGGRQFLTAGAGGKQFQMIDGCTSPPKTVTFIDGDETQVTQFNVTFINPKLIGIDLEITENGQQNEFLQTQFFLRNAN